jgi:hypothetical protein
LNKIGFIDEQKAVRWARQVIGIDGEPGFCRAISVIDDLGFRVVVVLSNFTPRNIDLHIALRPGTRFTPRTSIQLFRMVFGYVFNQLGAVRVTGLIKKSNIACRRFAEHIGFQLEGVMRKALPDDDVCIYSFLNSEFQTNRWAL